MLLITVLIGVTLLSLGLMVYGIHLLRTANSRPDILERSIFYFVISSILFLPSSIATYFVLFI